MHRHGAGDAAPVETAGTAVELDDAFPVRFAAR
jgi:hypothetical protein